MERDTGGVPTGDPHQKGVQPKQVLRGMVVFAARTKENITSKHYKKHCITGGAHDESSLAVAYQ